LQAQAGVGFSERGQKHVWFDSANANGYDSYPLKILTFSLQPSGRTGPEINDYTARFHIFQKSP